MEYTQEVDVERCNIWNQIRMGKIQNLPRLTLRGKNSFENQRCVYKSSVRSAMPYGRETWCISRNEVGIL